MLDLRKTKEIKLVEGGTNGLFCIVPVSADNNHPGYLMRADTKEMAEDWVQGLNRVREQELQKSPLETEGRPAEEPACCSWCCAKKRRNAAQEKEPLVAAKTG